MRRLRNQNGQMFFGVWLVVVMLGVCSCNLVEVCVCVVSKTGGGVFEPRRWVTAGSLRRGLVMVTLRIWGRDG